MSHGGIEPPSNPCQGFILTTILMGLSNFFTFVSLNKENELRNFFILDKILFNSKNAKFLFKY